MSRWRFAVGDNEDVVISTRIRLARNIKGIKFTNSFSLEEAEKVNKTISEAVEKIYPGEYKHLNLKDIKDYSKVLMENHLISPEMIKNIEFSSFCLSQDESVNILINEEDHLRLQVLKPGQAELSAFNRAINIVKSLEKEIDFSYHKEFGYLTSCPTNTGTGLRASVMMHLPALKHSGNMPGLIDSLGKLGLTVRGIYGENSSSEGDIFQISNQRTLGMQEEDVIYKLRLLVNKIIENERQERDKFLRNYNELFKDRVFRSLGTLKYAKLLPEEEALTCLSFIRVGICQKIYEGLNIKEVTDLMFNVQKNNILKYKKDTGLIGTEDSVRSEYIANYFKEVERHGE
ncbi:ATP--guanido phosphotransferase [Microaceticoccus formicicus]|uniref:ATP--guanido phosphotransferase n=1 Tax=Microaceticoccus formicicus TaxID=3118105 RepID=UPI003CD013E2|nr:ATP--guanido phosphotransferase [Peptoniphilaceae bacterium AMB_02]